MKTIQAYKRAPALENSTWYKGLLISQLAGNSDTDGAFDLVESKMKKGKRRYSLNLTMKMMVLASEDIRVPMVRPSSCVVTNLGVRSKVEMKGKRLCSSSFPLVVPVLS